MSHAAAFGIGAAIGFTISILMTLVFIPRLAGKTTKTTPAKRGRRWALVFLGLMIIPPLVGALLMPDFKTGLLLWIGDPVGYVLAQPLTLPLRYLARGRR